MINEKWNIVFSMKTGFTLELLHRFLQDVPKKKEEKKAP